MRKFYKKLKVLKSIYKVKNNLCLLKNSRYHNKNDTNQLEYLDTVDIICSENYIEKVLQELGLHKYVSSTLTGKTIKQQLYQFIQRLILFLNWNYGHIHSISLFGQVGIDALQFFKDVIERHYEFIPDFVDYLENKRGIATSSQLNYLYDISKAVKWFCMFRKNSHLYSISNLSFTRWLECIRIIRKPLSRKLRLERARENSIEKKIQYGSFPEGGLAQLKDCIRQDLDFIKSYMNIKFLDKCAFNRFMQVLYSSLYACGIQGRLSGQILL